MFNEYPYTDFHEMNLDWILEKMKEMSASIDNIPNLIDKLLSDKGLQEIISQYINELREQIADANEELNTASASRSVGELVFVQGKLYRVTKEMTAGDRYVDGGNCVKTTIEDLIYLILTSVTNLIEPNSKIASADRAVNDFVWLNGKLVKIIAPIKKGATYDVNNYVAFNVNDFYKEYTENQNKIDNEITNREALIDKSDNYTYIKNTMKYKFTGAFNYYFNYTEYVDTDGINRKLLIGTEKTNDLGKVINNFVKPEDYGAVGDGKTNDAEAFKNMIDDLANKSIKAICLSKTYIVNKYTISLPDYTVLFSDNGKGEIKVTQGTDTLIEFGTMCKIQNITLTGNSSTTGSLLVSRSDTLYARISNVTLQNAFKGLDLINAHGCLFSDMHILTCKYGIMFHTA